ncbi:hypothetical protein ACH4FA_03815 [Streptomyces sp. NPDC017966]|uniref:hypothetical protein n=1 Tax=Streptomyces sp. NPDC017966 TaxID=3365023 RepID=UPI003796B202
MTDDEMPEGEEVRLFAVPINDGFAREAAETLRGYRELAEKAIKEGEPSNPASPFAAEVNWLEAAPNPVGSARISFHRMLLDIAGMSWDTALDHVRALEHDIVRKPPPVWSPLVMARAVLESCLFFEYLFEPSISGALRLARCAGLWRKDAGHFANFASVLDSEREEAAVELEAYVTTTLDECNVVARHSASGRITGYMVDGEVADLDYNITMRARNSLPSWLPMPYGLLSGAAHGRPWLTHRGLDLGKETGGVAGEAATVMAALMVVMASLEMGLKAWQDYFGLDLADDLVELEQYRKLMSLRLMGFAHATE